MTENIEEYPKSHKMKQLDQSEARSRGCNEKSYAKFRLKKKFATLCALCKINKLKAFNKHVDLVSFRYFARVEYR